MSAKELRESLNKGLPKAKDEMMSAFKKCIEHRTRENKMKAKSAQKQYKHYVDMLELTDDELVEQFIAGNLL